MQENPLAFLSLIKLLESTVGHKTKYALLNPFPCPTTKGDNLDVIAIQNAAKVIAKHAGLTDLTFIVSVTTQEPSTAGHIELRYDAVEVFIELSQHIFRYDDAVLATLCHEISHKFLHVHGIRNGITQIEQEFLTDVTAVYLGMGKIMLNGCECQSCYSRTVNGKTTKTTHTLRTGYISRQCFAFVYRLVCEMRQIPAEQFLSGLSGAAREALSSCEQEYAEWFKADYHTLNGIEALRENLQNTVTTIQSTAAQHDCTLRAVEQRLSKMREKLRDVHQPLLQAAQSLSSLSKPNDNPHIRNLECVEARESASEQTSKSNRHVESLREEIKRIERMSWPEGSETDTAEVINCPIDQTRLRVPSGRRRLLVTCPACRYRFMVNTAITSNRQRILRAFRPIFGRKRSL